MVVVSTAVPADAEPLLTSAVLEPLPDADPVEAVL